MYAKCGDLDKANDLFETVEESAMATWTTMVVRYARFGCLDVARRHFDKIPEKKDVVPWNEMLSAYVQAHHCKEALPLSREMREMKVETDEVTMEHSISEFAFIVTLKSTAPP